MSSLPELRLDWCSYQAAKYAVEHWHYSRRMPIGAMLRCGIWEEGEFVGCVLFSRGANNSIGDAWGLPQTEVCELTRIAMGQHKAPVSQALSFSLKMLAGRCPNLRLVVSYADSEQGHHGGVYQAANWVYIGRGVGCREFFHQGRWKHSREVMGGAFGGRRQIADYSGLKARKTRGKHKYLYPLDKAMRAQIEPLRQPYPKRSAGSIDNDASGSQPGEGGVNPTPALQTKPRTGG